MKYTVKYSLVKSTGIVCPLRVRVSFNGKRVDARLGISLPESCWKAELQCAKADKSANKSLATETNKAIRDTTANIDELFQRLEVLEHRFPTAEEIKRAVGGENVGNITIEQLLHRYEKANDGVQSSTLFIYRNIINLFVEWRGNININDVGKEIVADFVNYLIYVRCLKNSSVSLYLSKLRTLFRFATKESLYGGDVLQYQEKLKCINKAIIYLDRDELLRLYKLELQQCLLRDIQQAFCFCCFTGLRFSDMQALRWTDVHDTFIDVVTQKTSESLRIELNNFSKAILEQRRGIIGSEYVFARSHIHSFTIRLRKLCFQAQIDSPVTLTYYKGAQRIEEVAPKYEVISSHSARKTFVVNSIRLGVPLEVVMKWTGHKDIEAVKPYLKIVDEVKAINMQKFDNFFE